MRWALSGFRYEGKVCHGSSQVCTPAFRCLWLPILFDLVRNWGLHKFPAAPACCRNPGREGRCLRTTI